MFKKIICLLLIIFVCTNGVCYATETDTEKNYIALGDSISAGYGLDDISLCFTSQIAEKHTGTVLLCLYQI